MTFTRRELFRIVSVAGAAAGLEGCEKLIPQAKQRAVRGPESMVTTACGACPSGCGISVRVVGGNAVQVQGVAGHPVNDGGLCPRGAAELQNLYHPERLRGPVVRAGGRGSGAWRPISWEDALRTAAEKLRGAEVVIAAGWVASAERKVLEHLAGGLGARLVEVRPLGSGRPVEGMRLLLGADDYLFDIGHSNYVLSLGADWLQTWDAPAEAQRAFAQMRRASERGQLVTVGPRLSTTAAHSDRWLPVADEHLALFGLSVLHALLSMGGAAIARRVGSLAAFAGALRFAPETVAPALGIERRDIDTLAEELSERSRPLVLSARESLPVQVVTMALDLAVGAADRAGGLVRAMGPRPLDPPPTPVAWAESVSFSEERPPAVLLYQSNPRYLAPRASGWDPALARAPFVAALGSFLDESAAGADLVLPLSTPLESRRLVWGATMDGEPFVSPGPAAVAPLYDTLDGGEALLRLARALGLHLPWADFGACLAAAAERLGAVELLQQGGSVRPSPTAPPPARPLGDDLIGATEVLRAAVDTPVASERRYPLSLHVHVPLAFLDGQGAHLPHLHGLSGPAGREVWNTVVEIHPEAARRAGIEDHAPVWVESAQGRIRAIARVRQGIRPDCVAIALGLGRTALGAWAAGHGQNPVQLLPADGRARVRVWRASS